MLDHLASSLIKKDWSIKALIREIMLSSTYQLGNSHDERNYEIDPENLVAGIFSKRAKLDHVLTEGERVEIYRPLQADPREVRRQLAEQGKTMGKAGR